MNLTIVIPNIICFASALLLFCYTGSMVLDQAYNLQLQAYSIGWYDYTTSEKKMLCLIMARTLRPCGMSALGYYYCDNAIFSSVNSCKLRAYFQNQHKQICFNFSDHVKCIFIVCFPPKCCVNTIWLEYKYSNFLQGIIKATV